MRLFGAGVLALALAGAVAPAAGSGWVLPKDTPRWGMEGGFQFALHPGGFTGGNGGPRGLIRLGYPTLTNGGYDLINFIAVEPIVHGKRGYSELEKSSSDEKPGKVFRAAKEARIVRGVTGEELVVEVEIEPFENGAHVRLKLRQRRNEPNELICAVEAEADSAPLESCILTATMGNKARTRILFLKDGPVSSLQLYPDYREEHFTVHRLFGAESLPRAENGDLLACVANDELNPGQVQPFGKAGFWDYRGFRVVQYWRKKAEEIGPGVTCAVNARYTYWMSKQPIPGGVAFENFELREPFKSGQSFTFGIRSGGTFFSTERSR